MKSAGRVRLLLPWSAAVGSRAQGSRAKGAWADALDRLLIAARLRTLLATGSGNPETAIALEIVMVVDDPEGEGSRASEQTALDLATQVRQETHVDVDRIECLLFEEPSREHATGYSPRRWAAALDLRQSSPGERVTDWLLAGDDYQSAELVGLLAAQLGGAALTNVEGFQPGHGGEVLLQRREYQGKLLGTYAVPAMSQLVLTVRSGATVETSDDDALGSHDDLPAAEVVVTSVEASVADRQVLATEKPDSESIDLGHAQRLVSAGRGVGSAEGIAPLRELAARLDATLSASRPVVDAGWLERQRQVGSSGQTVSPELYIAVGISGSIQHLQGMQASKCIVAINDDPEAPIWSVARYGICRDLHSVVPQWVRYLDEDEDEGEEN